jgi:hypothetical protein
MTTEPLQAEPASMPDREHSPRVSSDLSADQRQHYEELARADKYQHFVRIPERILRCLDHCRLTYDRKLVSERLRAYYLFIGVVDEAIDGGNLDAGNRILQAFTCKGPRASQSALFDSSSPGIMTRVLRQHTTDNNHALISAKLAELYREVVSEQMAPSVEAYIHQRKMVGSRTAELSYLLIRDSLHGDVYQVSQLMMQVGKVGCLIDSIIDLNLDWRAGLTSFKPSLLDRLNVAASAFWEGTKTIFRYPLLTIVFAEAVADNIHDRFCAPDKCSSLRPALHSDEATGVV